jgi:hypothetical protein
MGISTTLLETVLFDIILPMNNPIASSGVSPQAATVIYGASGGESDFWMVKCCIIRCYVKNDSLLHRDNCNPQCELEEISISNLADW